MQWEVEIVFGANSGQLTTGNSNCFFGSNAGAVCTTGFDNTFMGDFCGSSVSTGIDNVLLGAQAGNSLTTGGNNICLGSNAGIFLKTGSNNTFIVLIQPLLQQEFQMLRLLVLEFLFQQIILLFWVIT